MFSVHMNFFYYFKNYSLKYAKKKSISVIW